jgi:hypothetical protein
METKEIALEFKDEDEFRKAIGLLGKVKGRWALPGLLTVIIDARDIHPFEEANLDFERLPVVPAPLLSAEERREARARHATYIRR